MHYYLAVDPLAYPAIAEPAAPDAFAAVVKPAVGASGPELEPGPSFWLAPVPASVLWPAPGSEPVLEPAVEADYLGNCAIAAYFESVVAENGSSKVACAAVESFGLVLELSFAKHSVVSGTS